MRVIRKNVAKSSRGHDSLESETDTSAGSGHVRGTARCRVLFVNRSYWPDAEATGQLLTELCEDLADPFDVTVVAGQPNHNPTAAKFVRSGVEVRNGVTICRVRHTRFPKSFLPGRVLNLLSYLVLASWAALRVRRSDIVVVETDPPLLCLLGAMLKRWHRAKLIVYPQGIYPDVAVALGKLTDGWLSRVLRKLMFGVYHRANRVVVLSRDMRNLLIDAGIPAERIECLPNWVDTSAIYPVRTENPFRREHNLDGQFVVMYSGNMGLCQRLEGVLEAADRLRSRDDIVFLLVGNSVLKSRLLKTARDRRLPNVRFLPYQSKERLGQTLSAADLQLIPLDPRVASCLMPGKLYGVLASGSPALAIAPEDCELADIVRDHHVGMVVPPNEPEVLADAIRDAADQPWDLEDMLLRLQAPRRDAVPDTSAQVEARDFHEATGLAKPPRQAR